MFFFGIGMGGSYFPYMSELLQPNELAYATSFTWIISAFNTSMGFFLFNHLGYFFMFFIFSVSCYFGAYVMFTCGIDTNGMTKEDIKMTFIRKQFLYNYKGR